MQMAISAARRQISGTQIFHSLKKLMNFGRKRSQFISVRQRLEQDLRVFP
jgi:hypothetical protein